MDEEIKMPPLSFCTRATGSNAVVVHLPGQIRGRPVIRPPTGAQPNRLGSIAKTVLESIHWAWLDFTDRAMLICVDRTNYWSIGNGAVYSRILSKSEIDEDPRISRASQVSEAIRSGHRVCMAVMAEALHSIRPCVRQLTYLNSLLNLSVAEHTHPRYDELSNRRVACLWEQQLLGQPLTNTLETCLWNHQTNWLMRNQSNKTSSVQLKIEMIKRSIWGFFDPTSVGMSHKAGQLLCADSELTASDRKKAEVCRDLLSDLVTADKAEQNDAWRTWQGHLVTEDGRKALDELGLTDFVTLLHQQRLYSSENPSDDTKELIAKELLRLHETNYAPHLSALAGIALAAHQLENPTHVVDDARACAMLRSLMNQDYLRPAVREAARMALMSFDVQRPSQRRRRNDLSSAVFARRCLTESVTTDHQIHGLEIDRNTWSYDILVRLRALSAPNTYAAAAKIAGSSHCTAVQKRFHVAYVSDVNNVPHNATRALPSDPHVRIANANDNKIFAGAIKTWANNPPGSMRRIEAGFALARVFINDRTSGRLRFNANYASQVVQHLREILEFAQTRQHDTEARLLLAAMRVDVQTPLVSLEEATEFCTQVYDCAIGCSDDVKEKAIDLLARMR